MRGACGEEEFVVVLVPLRGAKSACSVVRGLRAVLKGLLRRHGLRCVGGYCAAACRLLICLHERRTQHLVCSFAVFAFVGLAAFVGARMSDEPWTVAEDLRPIRQCGRLSLAARLDLARASMEFAVDALTNGLPKPGSRARFPVRLRDEVILVQLRSALELIRDG